MIRSLKLMLAAIAFVAVAACDSAQEDAPIVEVEGAASPLFYEISGPTGVTHGWMLGTIHALPDGTDWLTPAIRSAIEEADHTLVEVVNLTDAQEIAETFSRLGTSPDQGSLSLRVSPQYTSSLDEMIEEAGLERTQFYDTETWAAAIMLSRVGSVGKPRNGVDRYIISRFQDRAVFGLELASEQLGIFDSLAEEDQRALLEGTIDEWLTSRDNPGRLTRAWLEGDEATLLQATNVGIMADPEIRDALLVQRNKDWLPTILIQLADTQKPFIAVGAAHLIGPDGLKTMLEAEGYTVTRISN